MTILWTIEKIPTGWRMVCRVDGQITDIIERTSKRSIKKWAHIIQKPQQSVNKLPKVKT